MKKIILISILVLAAFLRLYNLGNFPAMNADEAAIGYNAYSLLLTGKDEHGNSWPVHFQSFNDYKPGLYFYVVCPFVRLLGLNVWAVRLPSALFGVFTVLLVYLLVKELFKDEVFALTSSFFLSISPWHIHFSRGGWEVNTATFLITLGLWLFIKSVKKPKFLILSSLFFVLSLYTYHASRIIVPLLVIGLMLIYRKKVLRNIKSVVAAGLVGLVLLLPLIKDFTGSAVTSRVAGVGLFADPGPLDRINELRGEHSNFQSLPTRILHNKAVSYSMAFVENWSKHYSGEFLFLSGDEIQRNRVPETGQMYLFDIIFVLAGFVYIAKKPKRWSPILLWLIIAPFAAALTFQSPHALRAQNMTIPLVVISAYGLISLSKWLHKIVPKKLLLDSIFLLFVLIISWQFARYMDMYWGHMASKYPFSSQYGVKELVSYVEERQSDYEKIFVTNDYDQPYILFLFYLEYPPAKFQSNHSLTERDIFHFSTVDHFDKYYFIDINYNELITNNPNSLIIGTKEDIPEDETGVDEIYGSNGYLYFKAMKN
ncbi:MAG: glycosyltransferase family 39 protein [Microgenomates group bacterium]